MNSENGYITSLYITSEIPEKENSIIEQMQQNRVAGTIIITYQPENVSIAVLNNLYLTSKFFYSNLKIKLLRFMFLLMNNS